MTFHDKTATQITNINLNVKDLNTMIDYYTNILGFSVLSQNDEQAVLAIGKSGHTLTLNVLKDGRQPSASEAGLFHIAYLLPTDTDLANFLYYVANKGMRIGAGDHLVSQALYFADPEGNGIEIYSDRPKDGWIWNDGFVKMDTLEVDGPTLLLERTEDGWDGMPDGAKIGHLHLKTNSLEDAKSFYIDQIGFEHISKFPQALFMSTNKYHHHLAANTWQSSKKREDNDNSYGLSGFDIYKPNQSNETLTSPEGLTVQLHSDESKVPQQ
ncbi:VOC family protein [Staphylococcus pasteuri]|uniref:VOC family protein n=1 Tax=Staphylococcus pasteuri TaxID=45972 RepID=UPI001E3E4E60|nr:VOC family protein [Staphylococcus pasteuri]MCE3022498.1 VOC family protein [Staphylococcus pasteuri]